MLKSCNYLARNIYVQLSEIIRPYTLFQIAISNSFAALFFFSQSISMNLFAWEQMYYILMLQ